MVAMATPGRTSDGTSLAANFGSIVIDSNLLLTGSLMESYRENVYLGTSWKKLPKLLLYLQTNSQRETTVSTVRSALDGAVMGGCV